MPSNNWSAVKNVDTRFEWMKGSVGGIKKTIISHTKCCAYLY